MCNTNDTNYIINPSTYEQLFKKLTLFMLIQAKCLGIGEKAMADVNRCNGPRGLDSSRFYGGCYTPDTCPIAGST